MKETKTRILKAALTLFNEKGFVNVRLQHIADETHISVGNLAYHFENKQEILQTLYEELVHHQEMLLHELNVVPLFEYIDDHWNHVFKVQQTYRFFYIDTLEIHRSNPKIAEKHRYHIHWQIEQIKQLIGFNVSRGAFVHMEEQATSELAETLWMLENDWFHQSLIRNLGIGNSSISTRYLWNLLKPYFTEIGKKEYNQLQALKRKKTPIG